MKHPRRTAQPRTLLVAACWSLQSCSAAAPTTCSADEDAAQGCVSSSVLLQHRAPLTSYPSDLVPLVEEFPSLGQALQASPTVGGEQLLDQRRFTLALAINEALQAGVDDGQGLGEAPAPLTVLGPELALDLAGQAAPRASAEFASPAALSEIVHDGSLDSVPHHPGAIPHHPTMPSSSGKPEEEHHPTMPDSSDKPEEDGSSDDSKDGDSKDADSSDSSDKPKDADSSDKPKHADSSDKPKHADSSDKPTDRDSSDKPKHADNSDKPKDADSSDKPKHKGKDATDKAKESESSDEHKDSGSTEKDKDKDTEKDSAKKEASDGEHSKKAREKAESEESQSRRRHSKASSNSHKAASAKEAGSECEHCTADSAKCINATCTCYAPYTDKNCDIIVDENVTMMSPVRALWHEIKYGADITPYLPYVGILICILCLLNCCLRAEGLINEKPAGDDVEEMHEAWVWPDGDDENQSPGQENEKDPEGAAKKTPASHPPRARPKPEPGSYRTHKFMSGEWI
eukprot:TRINITY_DN4196_c0_g1_i1.p1 TRINITY_DN4196_c0_g1~~TRINITY_DN4196_c0_g1_i1.p1  ORF type:complete len:515 (+),score=124.29 TRINITY_DN4196_c0_g1_i1:56-1600(+)